MSEAYTGNISDHEMVKRSGVIHVFHAGDLILADKGFTIHDLMPQGVSVNLPSRKDSVF